MNWIERRPDDVAAQLLEYAETGRLVDGPRTDRGSQRGALALVVFSAFALGAAICFATNRALGPGGAFMIGGAVSAVLALVVLAVALRRLRLTPSGRPVKVRPAAVLPPELVQVGNWIFRDGAWMRIEQVGLDGGGTVHALLSSGEVAELRTPTTIAGDEFRPSHDPVASLRH